MRCAVIVPMLLLIASLAPGVSVAQGSGSTGHGSSGLTSIPLIVTRSVNGIVAEIEPKLRLITITDEKGKRHEFRVTPETLFFADKNTELAGKTELDLLNFQPGWPVRFTFRPDDRFNRLSELKLRRVKQ